MTLSNSPLLAAASARLDGPSNTPSGNTVRGIVHPPPDGLLSLPAEIRLHICSYITLSPVSPDSVANRGILGTCRQLQNDMFEEHGPAKDLNAYINASERPWVKSPRVDLLVTLGQPLASTRFICSVTLQMLAINLGTGWNEERQYCLDALEHLYSLHLDRLQILFEDHLPEHEDEDGSSGGGAGSVDDEAGSVDNEASLVGNEAVPVDNETDSMDDEPGPSSRPADTRRSDLSDYTVKSLHPAFFFDFLSAGKVNCRTAVFTVHELARAVGGRDKSTTLDISNSYAGVSYTMTIVQDKVEKQVEREFTSKTRFKRDALQARAG